MTYFEFTFQPRELELVEVKQRNLIDENGKGYVHFNFTVKKRLDGTIGLFFAEVHPDCREDDDVYLCTALEENVSGKWYLYTLNCCFMLIS